MSADSLTGSTGEPARQQHQVRHATLGTAGIAFFVNSAAALLTAMAGGAPWQCSSATVSAYRPYRGAAICRRRAFQSVSGFAVGPVERKRDAQTGSPSPRAVQINPTAEGVHSVLQPQKAGTARKFGAAHTVIGDL